MNLSLFADFYNSLQERLLLSASHLFSAMNPEQFLPSLTCNVFNFTLELLHFLTSDSRKENNVNRNAEWFSYLDLQGAQLHPQQTLPLNYPTLA